jgi:hypothetical protein
MIQETSGEVAEQAGSSDRVFGLFFSALLLLTALAPLLSHGAPRLAPLAAGALLLPLAIWTPGLLAPLNRLWTRFGLLLSRIFNPIMLAAIFFLIFTPAALLIRALRKKPLELEFDRDAASYWAECQESEKGSMQNQF